MHILCISGSSASQSSNHNLLKSIGQLFSDHSFSHGLALTDLPLYSVDNDMNPLPSIVKEFKSQVLAADAIIMSTPEYLHNIPAVLKNALEWLKSNGEIQHKRMLAITFTPKEPRGEKAMTSLLHSLSALEANVIGSLALYQDEITFHESGIIINPDTQKLLHEAITILTS